LFADAAAADQPPAATLALLAETPQPLRIGDGDPISTGL
jgi:hypothetical protein